MTDVCTLDIRRGSGGPMGELASLAENYLRSRVRRGEVGVGTAKCQLPVLRSLTATYGDRPVSKFSRRHVERWLETRCHLRASSRRCNLSTVRGFTSWLVRQGHIKRDPMAEIKSPRQPRSVPRTMPAEHVGKLLRTVPDARARAIVALGVWCGLRCCEIANLQVEDWDRTHRLIRVTGKGGHQRELPVPTEVRHHLQNYLIEHPATNGPFIRSYVHPWKPIKRQTISKMVADWMAEAGIKASPRDGVSAHALRHTAATDVYEECKDLRIVQEMLGHLHLATTAVYVGRAGIPKMRTAMEGRTYSQETNTA